MLKFKRFPNEHVISTLVRKRVQLAFPSNNSFMNYISLNCAYPKTFDLCTQVFNAALLIDGDNTKVNHSLVDGSSWASWRLSDSDKNLLESIETERNANLRQGELAFNRGWQFCLTCVRDDKKNYGVSYWHAQHQLPGITHCMKHQCPLYMAPPMKSIDKLVLPQYIDLHKSQQHSNSSELLKWSRFVYEINEALTRFPHKGAEYKSALRNSLPIESNKVTDITQTCMSFMDRLESEVSYEVLQHLFKYYSRPNAKRRLNLIRSALINDDTVTVRNPVYYLILMYWRRNQPELIKVLNDVQFAA